MEDITAPLYYVVSRTLTCDQEYAVRQAFSVTPIAGVIISDVMDAMNARTLSDEVFKVATDADAHTIAKMLGRPSVIIGDADILEAYYADGTKEKIV